MEQSERERVAVMVSGLITQRDSGGWRWLSDRREQAEAARRGRKQQDALQPERTSCRHAAVGAARTEPHTCQTRGEGNGQTSVPGMLTRAEVGARAFSRDDMYLFKSYCNLLKQI